MIPLLAAAPHLGGAAAPDISPVRIVLALLVCLAVAALVILMLRHRLGRGGPFPILRLWAAPAAEIVIGEVRRVGAHGDIATVRHAGREYLLLVQAGSARLLCERDVAPEDTPKR